MQAVADEKVERCTVYLQQALHNNNTTGVTNGTATSTAGSGVVAGTGTSGSITTSTSSSASVSWSSLLQGMSQALPKAAEDGSSAQWSAGIDQVQGLASFIVQGLNRELYRASYT